MTLFVGGGRYGGEPWAGQWDPNLSFRFFTDRQNEETHSLASTPETSPGQPPPDTSDPIYRQQTGGFQLRVITRDPQAICCFLGQ